MEETPLPVTINKVNADINEKLLKDFTGERTGFLQVGPKKWFFPSQYEKHANHYYNLKVRPDDVWVVTFPRSGTTWTQEMVWMIANDLNYEKSAAKPLTERFPFLEFSMFVHEETKAEFLKEHEDSPYRQNLIEEISQPGWKKLAETKERRFIKTHLPFSLLPPNLLTSGCKVIYVARNPKDVAVSFYHLNKVIRTQGYLGDFPTYWNYFENNLHPFTPYWEHIEEGWSRRNEKNLFFMFYEEMNKLQNLRGIIQKVANFLEKPINNEEDLQNLENYLNIDNFRKNKSVNYDMLKELGILTVGEAGFVRRGKTGGWKDEFSAELNSHADKWIEENLKKTDLRFPSG